MSPKIPRQRAKVLKEISKKSSRPSSESSLKEQYEVIRNDIIKLSEDLQKGWTIARESWGRRGSISQFRKNR